MPASKGEAPGLSYYVILLFATFLMASSFIAGKILLNFGFPSLLLVGWRFVVAAFAVLPLALIAGERIFPPLNIKQRLTVMLIGLLQTAGTMGLTFISLRTIPAATSGILLFTNPVWVALLAPLVLGESLSKLRVLGLLFGIAGVALALSSVATSASAGASAGSVSGDLIGLAGALCWSTSTIVNKRAALPIGSWTLSFWQMLTGALILLVLAYGEGDRWPPGMGALQWAWFLWLAIPGSAASFGLWFLALRRGGATRSSGYLFLAPFFTVLLSDLILKTELSFTQLAGGILIGASLWLVNRGGQSSSR